MNDSKTSGSSHGTYWDQCPAYLHGWIPGTASYLPWTHLLAEGVYA